MERWFKILARILVLRAPGTNCDEETARALRDVGASVELVHVKKIVERRIDINDFHGIVFPGGFSYGDRVRAGAIWATKLKSKIANSILEFVGDGKPVLGICNGFQVLVELGLLPYSKRGLQPHATLAPNISSKFEDRWVYLRCENVDKCIFVRRYERLEVVRMPIAHSEGRFILGDEGELERLISNGQIVFRYCDSRGDPANNSYPLNPNGSLYDIAGICNEEGNVLGLMPHPERAFYTWQYPDLKLLREGRVYGDGWGIFKCMVEYVEDSIV